ncbi:MAG: hypothetical protein IKJ65_00670 [Clostridia bacterium]|nr:hypothetical protein [Clostridia bacterium]
MRRISWLLLLALVMSLFVSAYAYEMRAEDEGFTVIAENETKALLFNEKTTEVRFVDLASGKVWDTAELNGAQGNRTIKSLQKSAIQASFITNSQTSPITTTTMDSQTYSVANEKYEWKLIENGVEITYTIGDSAYIIDDLPKAIRVDKYLKIVESSDWSTSQKKDFDSNYRPVAQKDSEYEYMIRAKDDSLSALLIKKLYEMIFSSGVYTQEDLLEDNAAVGYVRKYNPKVNMTVRYQLDGDDLLFSVPCSAISFTEGNELVSFSALPYMLTADNTQEGYIFVPDGSGALISLNNQKLSSTPYSMPIYGSDALINADDYVSERTDVALPVVAIKRTDSAMIAIIEKGEEMATIGANVSGHSDEFNRVSISFALRSLENVALAGNESITSSRYSDDIYEGDIVIRYKWLTDDNSNYLDIAKTYRGYLIENGLLKEAESEENAPFFMEILGAVNKDKFVLGIPYQSSVQATTIDKAQKIYEMAREKGIANIQLIYSGLFEGGIKNAALTDLELDSGIGSEKELNALNDLLQKNGDTFYPGVYWGRVYTDRDFSPLQEAARKHDGDPAYVYAFGEPVLKHARTNHQGYYISPYYLGEYTEKALKNMGRLSVSGLNLFDLGNTPIGDHKRKENLSRVHATETFKKALDAVSGEYELMLDKPLLYAFKYADSATNLPRGDNGFAITDYSIPFMQWVLDGCVTYSSESWNTESYMGYETQLLWALESKSAPRFTFSWEKPSVYANTEDVDYMAYYSSRYTDSLDVAAEMYAIYNDFYKTVADAELIGHEILDGDVRRVTYDNGVTLYLNYSYTDALVDGFTIPAGSYLIDKEVAP